MSNETDAILAQIKDLPPKERSLIMATLSLDAPTWVLDRKTQLVLEEVFPAFKMALVKYDIEVCAYQALLKSPFKDTFIAGCLSMKKYVENNFNFTDHRELDGILRSLMTVITDYMIDTIKIPLSGKTLSQQMKNIEYIIDLSFPGYKQNKLLALIIRPEQELVEL